MIISDCEQYSEKWWDLKVGKISGTRFGQVLSNRKNRLLYELVNEVVSGKIVQSNYISDDIQYGLDNERFALQLYSEQTGIAVIEAPTIMSESSSIHMASADGLSECNTIAQEIKCTQNGAIHIQRFFEGVDSNYIGQCVNYFAVAPKIQEVHFVSYCGERPERPIHIIKLHREDYVKQIAKGLERIDEIQEELSDLLKEYEF